MADVKIKNNIIDKAANGEFEFNPDENLYENALYAFQKMGKSVAILSATGRKPDHNEMFELCKLLAQEMKDLYEQILSYGIPISAIKPLVDTIKNHAGTFMQGAANGQFTGGLVDSGADVIIMKDMSVAFKMRVNVKNKEEALLRGAQACYHSIIVMFMSVGDCPEAYLAIPEIVSILNGLPG